MEIRVGTKLRSQTSTAELIVVRTPGGNLDLKADGIDLVPSDQASGPIGQAGAEPLQIGKRFSNESGALELLCVKPGNGVLTCGDEILSIKASKALPSSD